MKKLWNHLTALLVATAALFLGLIPCYYKRVLFMTTVYVHYTREGIFHEVTMSKLNQKLDLVRYEDCLEAPCMFADKIWKDRDFLRSIDMGLVERLRKGLPITPEQTDQLGTLIQERSPTWMRYQKRDMVDDFKRLLQMPAHA